MIKQTIVGIVFSVFSVQAFALEILCTNRALQDSQVTVTFKSNDTVISVEVNIPTGETSVKSASGTCVPEEDTTLLSIRCDEALTNDGEKYFARIDGKIAQVAKNGKIIATIPCEHQ